MTFAYALQLALHRITDPDVGRKATRFRREDKLQRDRIWRYLMVAFKGMGDLVTVQRLLYDKGIFKLKYQNDCNSHFFGLLGGGPISPLLSRDRPLAPLSCIKARMSIGSSSSPSVSSKSASEISSSSS